MWSGQLKCPSGVWERGQGWRWDLWVISKYGCLNLELEWSPKVDRSSRTEPGANQHGQSSAEKERPSQLRRNQWGRKSQASVVLRREWQTMPSAAEGWELAHWIMQSGGHWYKSSFVKKRGFEKLIGVGLRGNGWKRIARSYVHCQKPVDTCGNVNKQ